MHGEFARPKFNKMRALARSREKPSEIERDLREAKTFQQVIWRLQREELFQGADAAIISPKGETVLIQDVIEELDQIDIEEETGQPEKMAALRKLPGLFARAVELRSTRAELNSLYSRKYFAKITPNGTPFPVHGINRRKVRSLPPPADTVPIIIAPGFSVGPRAVRRNAVTLSELGRSSMTYAVPTNSYEIDLNLRFPDGTPSLSRVHASALRSAMRTADNNIFDGAEKYDVIGYSFGAIATLLAAAAAPEKFRNIILINPAGLHADTDPSTLTYLKRFVSTARRATKHREQVLSEIGEEPARMLDRVNVPKMMRQLGTFGDLPDFKYYKPGAYHEEFSAEMNEIAARGGIKEAVRTADGISWADMVPVIEKVLASGIKIRILPGENDPLFDVDEIERVGEKTGVPTYPIAGAHAELGFRPGAVAEICIDTLNEMKEPRG